MEKPDPTSPPPASDDLATVIDRNIRTLVQRRAEELRSASPQEKIVDAITSFIGSMTFVYIHLVVYGSWIIINLGDLPGVIPFDPTFVVLAVTASVEAIFVSTFVLIRQNRMASLNEKRADLDLQMSLLTEHEVTHLITLVSAIARRMEIAEGHNPELAELAKNVTPDKVLDQMEAHEAASRSTGGNP